MRIARTIADLEAAENIQTHHPAEAICTRRILVAAFRRRPESTA
ncbi:MAG: hypothetical protein LLG01_16985 [Planctomycetaceae bacterium]|nr:hypothetical protein [Planctomycetaceae bacterium]